MHTLNIRAKWTLIDEGFLGFSEGISPIFFKPLLQSLSKLVLGDSHKD